MADHRGPSAGRGGGGLLAAGPQRLPWIAGRYQLPIGSRPRLLSDRHLHCSVDPTDFGVMALALVQPQVIELDAQSFFPCHQLLLKRLAAGGAGTLVSLHDIASAQASVNFIGNAHAWRSVGFQ